MDPKAMYDVMHKAAECIESITDGGRELQAHILDMALEIFPVARRGALLLNRPDRVGCDPRDFFSHIYGERGSDAPVRFALSGKVLNYVYTHQKPCMSNSVLPIMCAPLIVSGAMIGIIYLEAMETSESFEMFHLDAFNRLSEFAAATIRTANEYQALQDETDLLLRQRFDDLQRFPE